MIEGAQATLAWRYHAAETVCAKVNRERSRFAWPVFTVIAALMLPMLAPFADHISERPVWGPYSQAYAFFLAALGVVGVSAAAVVTWLVRRVSRGRQLAFALMLVGLPVLSLLVAEAWLGLAGRDAFAWYRMWGHVRSPFFGYEASANHQWKVAGATYTTDSNAFRGRTAPRVLPDSEFLIVAMGGSAVFGYGLNDDETWPVRLERLLRERFGSSVTVLNAGCNGHNTLQQLFRAYVRVLPLKPDVVIHYGAINDVRTDAEVDQLIPFPAELVEARSTRDYLRLKNAGHGFYIENSLLLNQVGARLGLLSSDFLVPRFRGASAGEGRDTEFTKTSAAYLRNLDTLRLLCEREGTKFLPVTFVADVAQLRSPYDRGVERFVRALREDARERQLPLIDLAPAFERVSTKSDLFFQDHYHPNHIGAAFIAEHVANALAPMIQQCQPD